MTGWNSNTESLTQLERHEEILKASSRHDWLELKHQKSYTAWTSRRNSQSFVHTWLAGTQTPKVLHSLNVTKKFQRFVQIWLAGTQTPKVLHSLNFTKKFSLGNMSQKHAICCQVYRSILILLLLLLILDKTRGAILWVPSIGEAVNLTRDREKWRSLVATSSSANGWRNREQGEKEEEEEGGGGGGEEEEENIISMCVLGRTHHLRHRSLCDSSVNMCFCCAWPWPLTSSFYSLLSSFLS